MTNQEIKKAIQMTINTLNTIDVKGRENLNHLLGSILTLENLNNHLEEPEITFEEVKDADNQTE